MKVKKLSTGAKALFSVLILVALSLMAFGTAQIFAEPTIYELVDAPEIGEFKPNKLYKDEDMRVVGWLNTTMITFEMDWWTDTSGDGVVDVEDVYTQEGFAQHMLLDNMLYPIFEIDDEESNYYVVPLTDVNDIEGVIVQLQLAENNDLANMKDTKSYWFDQETKLLYVDKTLLKEDFENEKFNTIRAEYVMLVKNINEFTRKIVLATVFDSEIGNTYGMYNTVPNKDTEFAFSQWLLEGLKYKLVADRHLAYVSADNLSVYVNGIETDAWAYDEFTGEITINCKPYATRAVCVKINKLNNATVAQRTLQNIQAAADNSVGYAAPVDTLHDIVKNQNMFLHSIKYEHERPKVGATQSLGWTVWVPVSTANPNAVNVSPMVNGEESPAASTIKATVSEVLKTAQKVNGHYISSTVSASMSDYISGQRPYPLYFGEVIYNLYLGKQNPNSAADYMANALSAAQASLNNSGDEVIDYRDWTYFAMTTTWDYQADGNNALDGRYITGTNKETLLGGIIEEGDGKPYFDVTCARIEASNDIAASAAGLISAGATDYLTNISIVDVTEDSTGGYIYACVWSRTVRKVAGGYGPDNPPPYGGAHNQRVLAFSKIRYEYEGNGTLRFEKKDETTGNGLAGAVYGIYTNASCAAQYLKQTVTTQATPVNIELEAGTYYVKEITPPVGYLLDTKIHQVAVRGGEAIGLSVTDAKQQCTIELTVYDKTTKGTAKEMPVAGVQFNLYGPGGEDKGLYATNANGKLSVTVDAIGTYKLIQVGTATNYAMDMTSTSEDYCGDIRFNASPTQSGSNFTASRTHYENRQTISIKTHVQDKNLLNGSPAELGGGEGAKTSLVNAQYKLKAITDLFLGYNNGTAVTIPAGSELKIVTYANSDNMSQGNSYTAYSKNEGGKAYIIATGIEKGGKTYSLPNGKYTWILDNASAGYWNNGATATIDASWAEENNKVFHIDYEGDKSPAVLQERQTAKIALYVKAYDDAGKRPGESVTQSNIVVNNELTRLLSKFDAATQNPTITDYKYYLDSKYVKDITSDSASISNASVESAVLREGGATKFSIISSQPAPNTIYQLINLVDVVDINTGEEIARGTVLGYYIVDANGMVSITTIGGNDWADRMSVIAPDADTISYSIPVTKNQSIISGNALPNGVYGLTHKWSPDSKMRPEVGVSEDVVLEVVWKDTARESSLVSGSSVAFLHKTTNKPDGEPEIAPDVPPQDPDDPITPYDPYVPSHPDDPSDPDDSTDIPLVDPDWVDDNQDNLAYRIVDSANITGAAPNVFFEVTDKLPTTFAFYCKSDVDYDDIYTVRYFYSFYYQIESSEYVADNPEYIMQDGECYRRFAINSISGGDELTDVIVFNETSPGFIDYTEIAPKKTISGAIFNTEWLNSKLAAQEDGDYKILVKTDMRVSWEDKFTEMLMEEEIPCNAYGILTIKNRQLVNLD